MRILCIGTTPAAQRVMVFAELQIEAVNRAKKTLDGAAGKSVNVAKVLKALGEQPFATGFLGGDRGECIASILRDAGVDMDFVQVSARTRECVTIIETESGRHTELVEESPSVSEREFGALQAVIHRQMPGSRAVVLSGTLAPGVPVSFYRDCVRMARAQGALAVVDAQGAPLLHALEAKPDLVKPNRPELAATVKRELRSEADVFAGMRDMHGRGARTVVVTNGRAPTIAFDGRDFWEILAPEVIALNPIGSGDSFTAAVVVRLVKGDDLGEACRWGAAAGAANTLTWMAAEVRMAEVNALLPRVKVRKLDTAG